MPVLVTPLSSAPTLSRYEYAPRSLRDCARNKAKQPAAPQAILLEFKKRCARSTVAPIYPDMHSATVRDAARRLEEAAAIFRFKARAAREEYGELLSHWSDARSRQFAVRHIDPQHGLMEQGERLCLAHSEAVTSAQQAATSAENEVSAYR